MGSAIHKYRHVFSSLMSDGEIFSSTRLYFAPIGIDLAKDGAITDEMVDFYSDIIAGGCKFIVLSNATVSADSRLQDRGLCLYDTAHAQALMPLIQKVKQQDVKLVVQLQHYGGQGSTANTRKALLTPSGIPCKRMLAIDPSYRVKQASVKDIEQVVQAFGHSAKLAYETGVDTVLLQAGNGYFISSFLSPYTNKRTDKYGGDIVNRSRILCEIIDEIYKQTNHALDIMIRINVSDRLGDQGITPQMALELVHIIEKKGVKAVTCSICIGETFQDFFDKKTELEKELHDAVRLLKENVSMPVGFSGFIGSLQKAETLIKEGVADFVGMARPLFADNDLIVKTLEGREQDIVQCLWDGKCLKDKANPAYDRVYCCVNKKYLRPN